MCAGFTASETQAQFIAMSKDRQTEAKTTARGSRRTRARWHPSTWFSSTESGNDQSAESTDRAGTPAPTPRRERDADQVRVWYRTERVFYQNGAWYIATREGIDVGPYANSAAARRDSKRLIELLMHDARSGKKNHALTIHEFMLRPRMRHRD